MTTDSERQRNPSLRTLFGRRPRPQKESHRIRDTRTIDDILITVTTPVSTKTQVNHLTTYQGSSIHTNTTRCNIVALVDKSLRPPTTVMLSPPSQNPVRAWPLNPVFQHARRCLSHSVMYIRITLVFILHTWSRAIYSGTVGQTQNRLFQAYPGTLSFPLL